MSVDLYLEKCGKFFFFRIHPLFFFIGILAPFLWVGSLLFIKTTEIEELEERFKGAIQKEKKAIFKKESRERFLQRYSHADPYFLNHQIEPMIFLKNERQELDALLQVLPNYQPLQERIAFLTQGENRLIFYEENIHSSSQIKETEEKQKNPIQVNEEDLKMLLSSIEDIPIDSYSPPLHSPQLLIRDFRLKKQKTSLGREVYEIEMDLFKREFIK